MQEEEENKGAKEEKKVQRSAAPRPPRLPMAASGD